MYENILVPTDGSPATSRVLRHAIEIADRFDATLHGLYVLDARTGGPEAGFRRLRETLHSEGERAIERISTRAEKAGLDAETAVIEGTPHRGILEYVEEHDVDMIVMGTHGRSGVDRVLLGSVTERVVRLSDAPVLTVRLTSENPEVESEEAARTVAREALAREDRVDVEITDVYREAGTWVVTAGSDDGRCNVHIDAATGEAVVAELPN